MTNISTIYQPGMHLVPIRALGGEEELMQVLEFEDPGTPSADEPPHFLYRGQTLRRYRRWPARDEWFAPTDAYITDSIMPSDTRDMYEALRLHSPSSDGFKLAQFEYGNDVALLRALATYIAIGECPGAQNGQSPADPWFQKLSQSPPQEIFARLGSIGQHCGLRTAYLDVTSSKWAALWFASHKWDGCNGYAGPGDGIVYRINYEVLTQTNQAVNAMIGRQGMEACAAFDIRNTPDILTTRPRNQHGWVLVNLESPWCLFELVRRGGMEGFVFSRGDTATAVNTLQEQTDIAPKLDPTVTSLDAIYRQKLYLDELQAQIDQHSNHFSNRYDTHDQAVLDVIFRGWRV